jgi:hypothetical protein
MLHHSNFNVNNLGFNVLNDMHLSLGDQQAHCGGLCFQEGAAGQQSPLSDCQRLDGCGIWVVVVVRVVFNTNKVVVVLDSPTPVGHQSGRHSVWSSWWWRTFST